MGRKGRRPDNHQAGIVMSRRVRSAAAQVRLGEVQATLLDIARGEGIAPTLAGIAAQLNDRGLRRWRRGDGEYLPYDARSVAHSLAAMGLERSDIKRWRIQADRWAAQNDIPTGHVLHQLFQEWRYHHVMRSMQGKAINSAESTPFIPKFVDPKIWKSPWERNKHPYIKPLAAFIPVERLVKAWIGAFDQEDE